jgi:hypothetical protein
VLSLPSIWFRGATVPIGYFSCSLAKNGSVAQLSLLGISVAHSPKMAPWRNCIAHQISALRVAG